MYLRVFWKNFPQGLQHPVPGALLPAKHTIGKTGGEGTKMQPLLLHPTLWVNAKCGPCAWMQEIIFILIGAKSAMLFILAASGKRLASAYLCWCMLALQALIRQIDQVYFCLVFNRGDSGRVWMKSYLGCQCFHLRGATLQLLGRSSQGYGLFKGTCPPTLVEVPSRRQ